jgi:uncharacterized protein YbbK (DUF523 family)
MARNRFTEGHSPSCGSSRFFQAVRLAYLQAHVLDASDRNGENVKVVQELTRHASSAFTLQTYSQAQTRCKRAAQTRIVEALLTEEPWSCTPTPVAGDESGF